MWWIIKQLPQSILRNIPWAYSGLRLSIRIPRYFAGWLFNTLLTSPPNLEWLCFQMNRKIGKTFLLLSIEAFFLSLELEFDALYSYIASTIVLQNSHLILAFIPCHRKRSQYECRNFGNRSILIVRAFLLSTWSCVSIIVMQSFTRNNNYVFKW